MSKTHVAVWLRISPFYDMLLHISNCSEPTSKMLRISEVWRIRQIKFQKQSKKCKHFIPFLKFCLALNSYQIFISNQSRFFNASLKRSSTLAQSTDTFFTARKLSALP